MERLWGKDTLWLLRCLARGHKWIVVEVATGKARREDEEKWMEVDEKEGRRGEE